MRDGKAVTWDATGPRVVELREAVREVLRESGRAALSLPQVLGALSVMGVQAGSEGQDWAGDVRAELDALTADEVANTLPGRGGVPLWYWVPPLVSGDLARARERVRGLTWALVVALVALAVALVLLVAR